MQTLRRRAFWVLLAVSIAGGVALTVTYLLAFDALAGGPTILGYDVLNAAITSTSFEAALVVLTVAARLDIRRMRFAVGGLALASGVVGGVAAGLWRLGGTLAGFQPLEQVSEVNSLLVAVGGSGAQVASAAVVLGVGAALVAGVSLFVRWIRLDFYDRAAALVR